MGLRSPYRVCTLVFIRIALVQSTLASTELKHAFAPTGPFVPAPEQQFRHDVYLNGFRQFQLVALPENFHEGVDAAPELRLPAPSAWATVPVKAPSPWNVNSFADLRSLRGDFRTYPNYPAAWESVEMGWLRRTIRIPADWKGDWILLHFAAVAGDVRNRTFRSWISR